jgi:hypothetical protein
VIKFNKTNDHDWFAVKNQPLGYSAVERRVFADLLMNSKIKNFVLLQKPDRYFKNLNEDILHDKDWTSAGKNLVLGNYWEFLERPTEAPMKLNGVDINLREFIFRLGGLAPPQMLVAIHKSMKARLEEVWLQDFKQSG